MSDSPLASSPLDIRAREGASYSPTRRLLGEYALAWVREALRSGAAPQEEGAAAVVLLDPFAGADHPASPPLSARVLGAVEALVTRREGGTVRALLLDEDPVKVEWVQRALPAGAGGEGPLRGECREGEAEVLQGAEEAAAVRGAGAALALLDPPTAGRLPLEALAALLRGGADVLLRFPAADLRRLGPHHGSPLADLPPFARRGVEGISALLGDARHAWVFRWTTLYADRGGAAAEREMVAELAERLREASGGVVRMVTLAPAPAEPEHLLLATRAPGRALLLNRVLFTAREAGWLPWPDGEGDGWVRHEPSGELDLFAGGRAGAASGSRERRVDGVALAHSIATRFAGQTVCWGAVLQSLVDSDLFVDDVRRALTELRRDGRAMYRALASDASEIAFPRRRMPQGRRPRAAQRGRGGEAPLFAGSDPEGG